MSSLPFPPILNLKTSFKRPLQWAFASGFLTALVTLFMPNYYRSEVKLLPVESKGLGGNLGGLASAAAAFGVSVPGGDGNDANYVDILNSRWMREQVLTTQFQYHVRSWRFGPERAVRGTLYNYLEASNMDRAVNEVGNLLSSARDIKSKVISISAETRSPELSQLVAQRASKLLEIFLQEKGRTRGGAKAAFAEARLADARQEMDDSEQALRRFLESNRGYASSSDPGVRLKGTRLEAEYRLRQQLVSTLATNREQALLEEKNDIPILNVLDSGSLPIDKSRPVRSSIVLLGAFLAGIVAFLFVNRAWVLKVLNQETEIE